MPKAALNKKAGQGGATGPVPLTGSLGVTPVAVGGNVPVAGGGGGVAPPPAAAPPTMTNTAQHNPEVKSWLNQTQGAYNQARAAAPDPLLQESVANLRTRQSADTTGRAIDRASSKIDDQAAGQRRALQQRLGRANAGAGTALKLQGNIDEAAKRAKAGAAADISLGRERDLDQLALSGHGILSAPGQHNLQQQAMANNLLGMGMGGANTLAQTGLADRSLGLQQWQAQQGNALAQQEAQQRASSEKFGQWLAVQQLNQQAQNAAQNAAMGGYGGGGYGGGSSSGGRSAGLTRR